MATGYEIRLKGELEKSWQAWFDGFSIENSQGVSILSGSIKDQAALFGLLYKIHDLGLFIISIRQISQEITEQKKEN